MNYRNEKLKSQEKKTNRVARKEKRKIEKLQSYLLPEKPVLENISNSYNDTFILYFQNLNAYISSLSHKAQIEITSRLFNFLNDVEKILGLSKKKFKSGFSKTIKEEYCSKRGLIAYGFGPEKFSIDDMYELREFFKIYSRKDLEFNYFSFSKTYKKYESYFYRFYSLKKIAYIPYTCRSLFCRYCAWKNTRKRFSAIYTFLEKLISNGVKLSFITLTTPNHKLYETPKAIDEIFSLLENLYNFKLGERNLKRFHKKALIELGKYLANLHKKLKEKYKQKYPKHYILVTNHEVWKKKKEHLEILNKTIKLVENHLHLPDSQRRFGLIFNSIWKFEIKKNQNRDDFNSHWHGICLKPISRFFLKAITDYLGFGPIIDVRRVKGEKALVELSKYESKDVVSGEKLTFLEKVIINASLTHRKKFRLWLNLDKKKALKKKLEEIKNKDKDNLRYVLPKGEKASLDLKVSLSSIPKIYRYLRDKYPDKFEKIEIGKITYKIPKNISKTLLKPELELPVSIDENARFVVTNRSLAFIEALLKVEGKYEKFVKALFLRDIKEIKELYKGNAFAFIIERLNQSSKVAKWLEDLNRVKDKKRFLFIDLSNFYKSLWEKVLEIPSQIEEKEIPLPGPPPPDMDLNLDIDIGF